MSARLMAGVPSVGEPDVVRVVQLLAGVSARNDYNTGLNVRGGSADQNLVLLDGIPIYNPFHLGGLFSTFMDATVGGIELMTGAFPARYDGRLSSVLDVRFGGRDAHRASTRTTDVSVLATTGRLAGALGDGRGSWSIAARRTYADALASAFTRYNFPYHFLDLQGTRGVHVASTIGGSPSPATPGRDLLDLNLAEFAGDSTRLERGRREAWQLRLGQSRPRRDAREGVHIDGWARLAARAATSFEQRVSTSGFSTRLDIGDGALGAAERGARRPASRLVRCARRRERSRRSATRSRRRTCAMRRRRRRRAPRRSTSSRIPSRTSRWLDDLWRVSSRWMVEGGLRGEMLTGRRSWAALSPRLSIKYFVTPTVALTAAAGRVTQTMHSLAGDGPFRFFDIWLASDQYIPVETAWHWVVGVERRVETTYRCASEATSRNTTACSTRMRPRIRAAAATSFCLRRACRMASTCSRAGSRAHGTGWMAVVLVRRRSHERDGVRLGARQRPTARPQSRRDVAARALPTSARASATRRARRTRRSSARSRVASYDPSNDTWGTGNPQIYLEPLGGARNSARFPATQRLDLDVSREMVVPRRDGGAVSERRQRVQRAQRVRVHLRLLHRSRRRVAPYSQFPILPSVGVRVAF